MIKHRLTQRAADGWESAALICSFKALAGFCSQAFVHSRPPSAANASRWLASCKRLILLKKFAKLALLISICVFLTSCSSQETQLIKIPSSTTKSESPKVSPPSTAPPTPIASLFLTQTPPPTFPPYPPKQIILNYSFSGNHDAFDMVLGGSGHSKIVLYSDGQIIILGETYRQKQLSSDEVNWLLSQLEIMGFYTIETNQKHDTTDQLYDFKGQYERTDDGIYICVAVYGTKERKICTREHLNDFLIPPMKKILRFLDSYEPENMSLYQPDRLLLEIENGRLGFVDKNIKPISWSDKFPTLETESWKILYVQGEMANNIFASFGYFGIANDNGSEYTVYTRTLLPHEVPSWY
jgi:hypothetical protein